MVVLDHFNSFLTLVSTTIYSGNSIQDPLAKKVSIKKLDSKKDHTVINGFLIRSQIIGDSDFQSQSWIIKPYPNHTVLTPSWNMILVC